MLFEFVRFGILAALFFAVVLGVPYGYRRLHQGWSGTSNTGFMGTWVGTLAANGGKEMPLPDMTASPFVSRQQQQVGMADTLRLNREARESERALYLDISLDPYHIASPALRGEARVCDGRGKVVTLSITTLSVDDAGAQLILDSPTGDGFGNLNLRYNAPVLAASTQGFSPETAGTLVRGDLNAFQNACGQLRAKAAQP